ncbi:ABC transporter substrate-binding protein [Chitinophaga solisilvae]|uniref:ABC transporter substrate-binding protein n=1 Tax=Chitinophaga solisilvae TaxID=1233460 RepID=UPI00137020E9|nr:ABC transporter substrate-binding protein [Chitinophaga solisilvae]
MMKAGLLLPGSTMLPLIRHDFLQGLQAALQYAGIDKEVTLVTANINYGINQEQVRAEAEKMFFQEQADILIVYGDQPELSAIQQLALSLNKLVIIVNNGAKYQEDIAPNPVVLYHTLQNVVQCRLTGIHAAAHGAAGVCTSYYDGGYSHVHAMSQAYADHGGKVMFNFVSDYKVKDFHLQQLQAFLQTNPDTPSLLTLFNGDLAWHFLHRLQQLPEAAGKNIFASPMLLDETLAPVYGELNPHFRIGGYVPWTRTLDTEENKQFLQHFRSFAKREGSVLSMHGWENGLLLAHLFHNAPSHEFNGRKIVQLLRDIAINSPRGPISMDNNTHHIIAPAWYVQADPNFQLSVVTCVSQTDDVWKYIAEEKRTGISSGWINTYLCA